MSSVAKPQRPSGQSNGKSKERPKDEKRREKGKGRSKETEKKSHDLKKHRRDHARKILEQQAAKKQQRKTIMKESEFLCDMKFGNALPGIPFEPKFLSYPFPKDRFKKYQAHSLEKSFKYSIHPEPDLGIDIDLIDPECYTVPHPRPQLPVEDERLLAMDAPGAKPANAGKKRSRNLSEIRPDVPWLRKTVYMENNLYMQVHAFGSDAQFKEQQKAELQAKIAQRESSKHDRMETVRKSFVVANGKHALKHPSNPKLTATEIMPLLPDMERWPINFTHVAFDEDPITKDPAANTTETSTKRRRVDRAIITNVKKVQTRLVGDFLLPSKDMSAIEEGEAPADEGDTDVEGKFRFRRQYCLNNETTGTDYLMIFSEGKVSYAKVETRLQLRKEHDQTKSKKELSQEKEEKKLMTVFMSRREHDEREKQEKEDQLMVLSSLEE
jgi:RNA polymerase II-associated factor 1